MQLDDQAFKGRLPYRNGLLRCGNGDDDDDDDIELGSSESESNTASNDCDSNDGELGDKCSITAL